VRAAIVIPTEWHAATFSGDPRVLAGGFEAIGHSATIVCAPGSTYPPETRAITLDRDRAVDPGWWRHQNFDLAVVFTWMHSHHGVLKGIAGSDTFVISKGDTAGLYGARAHPRDTLEAAIRSAENPASAARNVWLWCKRLVVTKEHNDHARPFVANLRQADATVVETQAARENVCRFLTSSGATDLVSRLHVVPNPSAPPFVTVDVSGLKERLIYAAGRWEAREKNFGLLQRSLEAYLRKDPQAYAVIAGRVPMRIPALKTSRIEFIGAVGRETLAEVAARARVCLVTSRWESFHLAAHEALTAGATVVGTPIPVVADMTSRGCYGTTASSHRPASVLAALTREMRFWDDGRRDGATIAAEWRGRLAPEIVARQLFGLRTSAGTR
jgi:Glycosyl transferases group 1